MRGLGMKQTAFLLRLVSGKVNLYANSYTQVSMKTSQGNEFHTHTQDRTNTSFYMIRFENSEGNDFLFFVSAKEIMKHLSICDYFSEKEKSYFVKDEFKLIEEFNNNCK